jgi:hypothetical protein
MLWGQWHYFPGAGKVALFVKPIIYTTILFGQEIKILLIHGKHSAFYPAPYVDEHGDAHNYFKGKPLQLDYARLSVLRKMWLAHNVPTEVANRRMALNSVIRDNYY